MRVLDASILKSKMTRLDDPASLAGKVSGTGSVFAIANTGQVSLLPLVYKLKGATIKVAEKSFDAEGKHFAAGSLLITNAPEDRVGAILQDLALDATLNPPQSLLSRPTP